jgi:hypothetical protein
MKRLFATSILALGTMFFFSGSLTAQAPAPSPNPQPAAKPTVDAHAGHDHAAHPEVVAAAQGGGIFKFEEETHDFGEMMQGGDASFVFKFTNVGTEDIKITLAKGSCGCTVPTWPQEAIAPGASGEIAVKYDSNRIGEFNKNVTIISDAAGGEKVIYIKGKVNPKPADPVFTAPAEGPANK